jgi:hypothetical protein
MYLVPLIILGSGKSSTLEAKEFYENEINVIVKVYFSSNSKTIVLERTVPVLYREMDSVRF